MSEQSPDWQAGYAQALDDCCHEVARHLRGVTGMATAARLRAEFGPRHGQRVPATPTIREAMEPRP